MKEIEKEILKPKDVAAILKVTTKTLIEWDKNGKLKAHRNINDRRYYTRDQINEFLCIENRISNKIVIYARVSNNGQKDDLKNQIEFLQEYADNKQYKIDDIITDIGSGLNYERKNWNRLLIDIENYKISKVIISFKDRFVRFGYSWFESYCKRYGCTIEVVNENTEYKSPEEEMIEDLISIIRVFSCRIYGLRKYKRKEDLLDDRPKDTNLPD